MLKTNKKAKGQTTKDELKELQSIDWSPDKKQTHCKVKDTSKEPLSAFRIIEDFIMEISPKAAKKVMKHHKREFIRSPYISVKNRIKIAYATDCIMGLLKTLDKYKNQDC